MKKSLILIIVLLCAQNIQAGAMSAEEWLKYASDVKTYLEDYKQRMAAGEEQPIKCGTPIFLDLHNKRPDNVATATLDFGDRLDSMSFTYGTTHFLFHYTDTGLDLIYQFDRQDSLPGTPNFIFMAGIYSEQVYDHLIDDLGYDVPLSDGYYNGGGDGRIDIYFSDVPFYGATFADSMVTPVTYTSYLYMENDYDGFQGYENDRLAALSVTLAHEIFHVIQFSYDIAEVETTPIPRDLNASWIEMSAVFMEEEHFDDVNDYEKFYLIFFYNFPHYSLRFGTYQTGFYENRNLHMYGSVVWPLFLAQKYDSEIITQIWDSCRATQGPNWVSATDDVINTRSGGTESMSSLFREFALWNLFTGLRARPGEYFEEADLYNMVLLADEVNSYPAVIQVDDSLQPDCWAANYIMLNNLSSMTEGIRITFNPAPGYPWDLQVVGLPSNVSADPIYFDPEIYDENTTHISIPDASSFNQIVLIPSVLGTIDSTIDYSMVISALGEGVIRPNGGEVLYAGMVYDISWFFADSITTVDIDLSTDNGVSWSDIAEVSNLDAAYTWTVPELASTECLIRIADADNPSSFDISDAVFTIDVAGGNQVFDPYPNPGWVQSHDSVTFKAVIAPGNSDQLMKVTILNMSGEKIRDIDMSLSGIGSLTIGWDFKNNDGEIVAAGPYIAVIELGGETYLKKIMVLR
ncbi:MAG: MXAN_6640 family putative metalloprotease [candidate division Zixibacteria bacterium]